MRVKLGIIFTILLASIVITSLAMGNSLLFYNQEQDNIQTLSIPIEHMPIKIDNIILTKFDRIDHLEYVVRNLSNEPVINIKWTLLAFDKNGSLLDTQEWIDRKVIEPNSSGKFSYSSINNQGQGLRLVLVSQEVVTQTGRWNIDQPMLSSLVSKGFEETISKSLNALYDPNVVLTDTDKLDLYKMVLNHALKDETALEVLHIEDPKHIFLKSDEIIDQIKFLTVPGVKINFIAGNKIHEKANHDGKVIYIALYSTEIVGSDIWVTIESHEDVRTRTVFTPCCGGLKYRFRKEFGGWKIQEVLSYNL